MPSGKAVNMLCRIVLHLTVVSVGVWCLTQFSTEECYNRQKTCGNVQLRKTCHFTRWDCAEFGYPVHNDAEYPQITGKCNEQGPRVFCSSKEKAEECKANQTICRKLGYWIF